MYVLVLKLGDLVTHWSIEEKMIAYTILMENEAALLYFRMILLKYCLVY